MVVRGEQGGERTGGQLFQQRQQRSDNLVEVGFVIAHRREQTVEDRIVEFLRVEVLFQRHYVRIASQHMARRVFVVNALRQLRHHFPRPSVVARQHDAGIVDKQGVDIDHVAGN